MKKLIIILLSTMFFFGCVSIKYNTKTGDFDYSRFGDQAIQGLDISKEADGSFKLKMDNQLSKGIISLEDLLLILKDNWGPM